MTHIVTNAPTFAPFESLTDADFDRVVSHIFRNGRSAYDSFDAAYPPVPAVGDRVRLRCDVVKYMDFIAPKGLTGTVTVSAADELCGYIAVVMDEPLPGAEPWDNEIHWRSGDQDDPEEYAVLHFWNDCALIVNPEDCR